MYLLWRLNVQSHGILSLVTSCICSGHAALKHLRNCNLIKKTYIIMLLHIILTSKLQPMLIIHLVVIFV